MNKKVLIISLMISMVLQVTLFCASGSSSNIDNQKGTAPFLSEEDQDRNFLSQSLVGKDIRYLTLE